ncbi:MAG: hypothetical protein ABIJ61_02415 [bacterium]
MAWNEVLSLGGVGSSRAKVIKVVVTLLVAVIGVVTAYNTTVNDLKAELATKVDAEAVERVNIRLARIETLLSEVVATKQEQLTLATEIERRLSAIEAKLR